MSQGIATKRTLDADSKEKISQKSSPQVSDLNDPRGTSSTVSSRSPSDSRSNSEDADHLTSTLHLAAEEKSMSENSENSKSVDSVNSSESKLGRSLPKSRSGCITCKVRRKKCDEVRPVCKDCQRFKKECVWIDPNTMSFQDVRKLKEQVQARESNSKLRNRSRTIIRRNDREKSLTPIENPIIQVKVEELEALDQDCQPLDQSQSSLGASEFQKPKTSKPARIAQPHKKPKKRQSPQVQSKVQKLPKAYVDNTAKQPKLNHQNIDLRDNIEDRVAGLGMKSPKFNDFSQTPSLSAFSPCNNYAMKSPHDGAYSHVKKEPLALEHSSKFEEASSTSPTSSTFFNFLREASLFASSSLDKLTLLDLNQETNASQREHNGSSNLALNELKHSCGFNIFDFLEQVNPLSHDSPTQFLQLASNFNAAFSTAPQPALSEVPELDAQGLFLYNYYLETLSKKVSIAPTSQNESNSYQRVFLPLAQKDKGVLYAILAWAGFHLGGKYMREGSKYAEMAVNNLLRDVDFTRSACIKDRRTIVFKLATILILCGAEICRGDVKIWSVYLEWGWRLLRDNGGILNFDNNKEEHWLISNFAYHDLLAVSERPSYFTHETYDNIFSDPNGNSTGNLNPLLGVSKTLYKVIGEINQYAFEAKTPMRYYYGKRSSSAFKSFNLSPSDSITSDCSEQSNTSSQAEALSCLHASLNKAKELDQFIENCRPEMSDLVNLSDSDLELQLTTFEAFQVSCKLHLRQSILKLNPSALECQILVHHLTKCIDILIGSPMQATLVFPIFIAGLFMVTEDDKQAMKNRFELMMRLYGPWNVVRAKYVVEKVWELNPDGDKWCDWCSILHDLGWELNFA